MNRQARTALSALEALTSLDGASPSPEQRVMLTGWTGWGPLAPALGMEPTEEWTEAADRLEELLSESAYDAARDVCDTSFFTPDVVIDSVFKLLRSTGFTGGRVLEPGCGSGAFMGRAPADMNIDWVGVDVDPTATAIASVLYPSANIVLSPLEKFALPTGSFDAVVANVPFSSSRVFDPAYTSAPLHEYFIDRAIDAVRPGGYVIAVTSRHQLDGGGTVHKDADLISAVRLPSGAFDGTSVVADILVLRKRAASTVVSAWVEPTEEKRRYAGYYHETFLAPAKLTVSTGAHTAEVSGLWAEHLDCVAGQLTASGFHKAPLKVISNDKDGDIRRAVDAAASFIVPVAPGTSEFAAELADVILDDGDGRKERSFHLVDGKLHQVVNGELTVMARQSAELKALLPLRDAALELIDLEANPDTPDNEIAPTRAAALALYEAYVAKFGALNRGDVIEGKIDVETGEPALSWRRPSQGGFRNDPDYVAALALEDFDQNTGEARPAPILLRRVGAHPPRATSAASAEEALALSMGESGSVDTERVAELLSTTVEDVTRTLVERSLVFLDPSNGARPTLAREYLSGNVRQKLAIAESAASRDDSYARNVTALQAVMPAELDENAILAQLGASWVSTGDMEDFVRDTFGCSSKVKHTPALATWEVEGWGASAESGLLYATPDFDVFAILEHGLNGKTPIKYDEHYVNGKTKRVRNPEKSLAATEALSTVQARFAAWVWENKARSERLKTEYNTRFNSHVVRRGDGAYLTFPGMDASVDLWAWQRDAVDCIISKERVVIAHPVGAGKTRSFIAGAMTLRRLGLARKPVLVVPNHLLEQVAREAKQTYPTGKFLIASKEDLTKENRRLFAARCATGDWDCVIMTQQAFGAIGVDPETESEWLEEQKSELRWHLMDTKSENRRGAKLIANAVRRLETTISELRHKQADPDSFTFEQLGIDHISMDEFHYYRRLPIATRAEGFNLGSSKRSTDLLLKIETLAARRPGKPVFAGFTGTLWSNTLAETYVWQKFLQPERLREAGVEHFDAWAATFVRYETNVEVSPDGSSFRMYRRPSVIQNVPELRLMLSDVADLLTPEVIGLERPPATWTNVVTEPGEEQAAFVADLAARADAIRNPALRKAGNTDNMLVVCGDGRRVALDPQLVGIDEASTKVAAAAERIIATYLDKLTTTYGDSTVTGNLQLVMCDIGTPRPDDSQTYGRLRAALIAGGIPASRIRFIHDSKTDKARAHLFAQCREGAVSVLIGSTGTVGVGTNIQTRLDTLHHLDAPWRPSDIEQREGRALRPGNKSAHVNIYRYVTEKSFDAYMWQLLEVKQRFISQMYTADSTVREIADVSDVVLSFAEVKALSSGNPQLLRHAEITNEVRRLSVTKAVWSQGVRELSWQAEQATKRADTNRRRAKALGEAAAVMSQADASASVSFAGFVKELRAGKHSMGVRWRGLHVRMAGSYYDVARGDRLVQVQVSYQTATEFIVPRGLARKNSAAAFVLDQLEAWAASIDKQQSSLLAEASELDARARQLNAVANAAAFDHEDALVAAQSALDVLNAQLSAEASESSTMALAA